MPTIGVYARLRPVAKRAEEGIEMDAGGCSILVRNLEFTLDHIFDERASQEEVYEVVGRDRVAQVVKGFNVCLVAYGQTGSGKTHTMFGPEEVLTNWRGSPADQHGIALRAMSDLFEAAAADAYTITCSYVEVYNDTCVDLLAREKKALPLRELPSGTPFVAGLTEEEVASVDSALSALSRGTAARATAQMSMNARSSRSHAVFSLALRGSAGATDGSTTSGKLVLVDLAGMESSKKSSSVEGASSAGPRREEAKHINTSLYALGTVIERLSVASREGDGAILSHVPFRNSKLTRLLQALALTLTLTCLHACHTECAWALNACCRNACSHGMPAVSERLCRNVFTATRRQPSSQRCAPSRRTWRSAWRRCALPSAPRQSPSWCAPTSRQRLSIRKHSKRSSKP